MNDYSQLNIIAHEDMASVRTLAQKYNMSVADFGRAVARQARGNASYKYVRVSTSEENIITEKAKRINISIAQLFSFACHDFLELREGDNDNRFFYDVKKKTDDKRSQRIPYAFTNKREEIEMQKIALKYSIKISTLVRYCALHFDVSKIIQ